MSTFTMRLKDVIEVSPGGIGLDAYPIFDPAYRVPLNTKIIQHFWNQEIGVENDTVFKFNLARKMNEIMPYYNKMFFSERIQFDPLSTVNIDTVAKALTENNTVSDGISDSLGDNLATAITVNSAFPQTALDENDTGNYADSSTESKSDAKSTGKVTDKRTDTVNAEDNTTSNTKGYQGSAAALLQQYRATLLNIDMAIISDLQELFMAIWDTNDSYFENGYSL